MYSSQLKVIDECCVNNVASSNEAYEKALEDAADSFPHELRPVLITAKHEDALRLKRTMADRNMLGIDSMSLMSWVADLWELFGDGRVLIESTHRGLFAGMALREYVELNPELGLQVGSSTAMQIARIAKEALPRVMKVLSDDEFPFSSLSENEQEALLVVSLYKKLLDKYNLVEYSEALDAIQADPCRYGFGPIVVGKTPTDFTMAEHNFLEAAAARFYVNRRTVPPEAFFVSEVDGFTTEGDGAAAEADSSATGIEKPSAEAKASTEERLSFTPTPEGSRAAELSNLLSRLYRPNETDPVSPTGALRFVLPAGRYAASSAIAKEIVATFEEIPGASVAVAAANSLAIFDDLAPKLVAQGISVSLRALTPFFDIEFGRALRALIETLYASPEETALRSDLFALQSQSEDDTVAFGPIAHAAADFALSPYSGLSMQCAYRADTRWRGNRRLDRDSVLTDLAGMAEGSMNGIVGSFEAGHADEAFDVLHQHISRMNCPEGYRVRQLAALAVARRVFSEAETYNCSYSDCLWMLKHMSVPYSLVALAEDGKGVSADDRPVSGSVRAANRSESSVVGTTATASYEVSAADHAATSKSKQPTVSIMSLEHAASMEPCSFDVLFVTDLTATAYSLDQKEDSVHTLLEKLGVAMPRDELMKSRQNFYDALATARKRVVLSRPLNTTNGDAERPAVVFEDALDCYRKNLQDASELDRTTGLPHILLPYATCCGEQNIFQLFSTDGAPQQLPYVTDILPTGFVTPAARDKILLPVQWGGEVIPGNSISPSAIESYLECPYKWFAHRRMRLEDIDAGFGPREFGLFAHRVLDLFYERYRAEYGPKLVPEKLDVARELLSAAFDENFKYGMNLSRISKNTLIPLSDLEMREVEELRQKLLRYLSREAKLLPSFAPVAGEVSFGLGADAFEYAGFRVSGSIDRLDVDAFGRAVVIDYKGAVDKVYALRESADAERTASRAGSATVEVSGACDADFAGVDASDFVPDSFAFDASTPNASTPSSAPVSLVATTGSGTVEFVLPRKVQTLVYAQAVRRTMGLTPVGAIYVSYGKDEGIAGAYDRTVLDPSDLPGINPTTNGTHNFLGLLDAVEEAIAEKLSRLLAGDVAACPSDERACKWCPVTVCSMRGGACMPQEADF